ncbi:MAG: 4Fe-4S dicluster domain-containing protein [Desulfopila sp.]
MHYAMMIDLNRCVGCHACVIACKAEWEVPVEFSRNWVRQLGPAVVDNELASTCYPGLCNHCSEPVCVPECPADLVEMTFTDPKTGEKKVEEVAATWKDPFTGIVLVDKSRCLGCGACVDACPYGARYINPALTDEVSSDGKADKCTFCEPRLEAGISPACVQTCITGARIFGDLDDPKSEVAAYVQKGAKGIEPQGGNLGPNVRYYGKKKDLGLLLATSTPQLADLGLVRRRALLAALGRSVKKGAGNLGLLGVAGSLLAAAGAHSEEEDR